MLNVDRAQWRIAGLTACAMIAFAANSLLCRLALREELIDAATFTTVRIVAGAATLAAIIWLRDRRLAIKPDWLAVVALFVYMVFFSFAYLSLTAATGALLLFGAVQLTMFIAAIRGGERYSAASWLGFAIAVAGLVYLLAPGVSAPDLTGAMLMTVAGVGWGVYSLVGRQASRPLLATAGNFLYAIPLTVVAYVAFPGNSMMSSPGVMLAIASGALASGLGYAIWYAALAGLTAGRAATVQLSVPVIAAIGGVLLLAESASLRLVLASIMTIGGIWLSLAQRSGSAAASSKVC